MQRKLFIIRHGKSSWESIVNDIDRPLTERGVNNSYEMAQRMKGQNQVPELIISSPANRAFHTAIIMAKIWSIPDQNIQISSKLYLPDENAILSLLFGTSDDVSSLAIFGHNPGFTDFANRFLDTPLQNLPTAGVVIISMDIQSWTDIVNCKVLESTIDCPKKAH
jgi:phosphohistidine phosphatase